MIQPAVRKKLAKMAIDDQKFRKVVWTKEVAAKQKEYDIENMKKLADYIEEFGWPTIPDVGLDLSNAMILIAQHNCSWNLIESKEFYNLAYEKWVEEPSLVDSRRLTNWIDALCLMEGKEQQYGQYLVGNAKGGTLRIHPIADVKNLNKRRKEMGLGTFDERMKEHLTLNPESRKSLLDSYKEIFGKKFVSKD